ncbi:GTP-binding protein [Roseococcus sp. SYP-B2431]|uniref:GTP-binding protein n=1 Tax=Roseococcus sp. SYP-B2431 TaxID=2496640 RepID=UPI0013F41417|nr:GTP-binding protein [Roseococcus sp. SYP-B2431]
MTWSLDARIPLSVLPDAASLAAALAQGKPAAVLGPRGGPEGGVASERFAAGASPHAVACACCQGRGEAAQALDRLFQARVRGTVPWFDRVLVLDEGGVGEEVRRALTQDKLAAARYRLS